MSDEIVETPDTQDGAEQELSRKERAAARRAEFETAKAAKDAEKAAAKAAALEEKLATKQAEQEARRAAKAEKAAAKEAKRAAGNEPTGEPRKEKTPKEKTPKVKAEKDPYRPRFAVAPAKVRAFTVFAGLFALVHAVGAALLLLETTASPLLGVLPEDMGALAYSGAAVSAMVAVLWVSAASLLCTGRALGKTLGIVALVIGFPLSLVTAPLLFSNDVRDWAL